MAHGAFVPASPSSCAHASVSHASGRDSPLAHSRSCSLDDVTMRTPVGSPSIEYGAVRNASGTIHVGPPIIAWPGRPIASCRCTRHAGAMASVLLAWSRKRARSAIEAAACEMTLSGSRVSCVVSPRLRAVMTPREDQIRRACSTGSRRMRCGGGCGDADGSGSRPNMASASSVSSRTWSGSCILSGVVASILIVMYEGGYIRTTPREEARGLGSPRHGSNNLRKLCPSLYCFCHIILSCRMGFMTIVSCALGQSELVQ